MNLLFFISDDITSFNSSRWTVCNAADALIKQEKAGVRILDIKEWLGRSETSRFFGNWADIIVLQRVAVTESIEYAQYWIQRGKKVVLQWDDGYRELVESEDTSNPAYAFWGEGEVSVSRGSFSYKKHIGYDPLTKFAEGLSRLSAGTVPSRVIASDYQEHNNVFYLPNYIDAGRYKDVPKKAHDGFYIGYGSSLGHKRSAEKSGIKDALARVVRERKNVYLFLIGDERLIKSFGVPEHKVAFKPYVPYWRWSEMLAFYDIAIAPLWGEFDMRRSFLKAVEAAVSRIPLVATGDNKYPVYRDFFECPSHIYVPSEKTMPHYDDRVDAWEEALLRMIDNHDVYQDRANVDGFEWGMEFDVEKNTDSILGVYEKVQGLP